MCLFRILATHGKLLHMNRSISTSIFLILCVTLTFGFSFGQTTIGGLINTVASPVTTINSGTSVDVQSTVGFNANDTVLIIQMKGATIDETNTAAFGDITSIGNAGNYELAIICSVNGQTVTFQSSLSNSYDANGSVQLIRVDTYNDVVVNNQLFAPAWNASPGTGGVLIVVASGSITLNQDIVMFGTGFRGGWAQENYSACSCGCSPSDPQYPDYFYPSGSCRAAGKGEGITDSIAGKEFGMGNLANGGGGGNDHNAGGGGGSNYGVGGVGGTASPANCFFGDYCRGYYPGEGGSDLSSYYTGSNKLFLGGGGGAGHANNLPGTDGRAGGGIIILIADVLNSNGNFIDASGLNVTAYNDGDGHGGGGAGGTIVLDVNTINGSLNLDVSGGQGGNVDSFSATNCKGPGGGGGGGVILTSNTLPGAVTTNLSGGNSGVQTGTNCTGQTNGALAGANGAVINGISISIGGSSGPTTVDTQVACETYTWIDGNTYTSSNNTANHTLTSSQGCDSIIQLDLTILNNATSTDVVVTCGSYTWIDGNTYTSSTNTPTHTYIGGAANGCDSIVTLDLTITSYATGTDVQSACDSYTWIDGNTYSSSTNTPTYTYVGGAANGCDSIVTLDLTINNSTSGTDVVSACGSYTWIDGNTYSSSTNTPTYTYTGGATNGCDSTVTLNLTITSFASGTDVQTACDSYTWIDGNTYSSSTNTPTYTYVGGAANGCDSVVTLDLTINSSSTGTDNQTACDTYTWIDGNTYISSTNTPTWTLTNSTGCDSVVTLNLTINNSNAGTDVVTACASYTWIDGNTYTSSTSTPTWTLTNSTGCDSVITLNLTINPMPVVVVSQNDTLLTAIQAGANYQWLDCDNAYAPIPGETGQGFQPSVNGTYAVEVTLNGCVDTSSCYLVDNIGLSDLYKDILSIHPNPASEYLLIDGLEQVIGYRQMKITTADGKLVFESDDIIKSLDVSEMPAGTYLLNIHHTNGIETIRFIKQ